jgi:hypothetical protein
MMLGARAVLYCVWFAKERKRGSKSVHDLDIQAFRASVAEQMRIWRAARVASV